MNNRKALILLAAAKEAYNEGHLSPNQYLKLLEDIESGILINESKKIDIEIKLLIEKYAFS